MAAAHSGLLSNRWRNKETSTLLSTQTGEGSEEASRGDISELRDDQHHSQVNLEVGSRWELFTVEHVEKSSWP